MNRIIELIKIPFLYVKLFVGLIIFKLKGATPSFAYNSMIGLFCRTGGVSNDAFHKLIALTRAKYTFPSTSGLIGDFSNEDVTRIGKKLQEDGYYVFEKRLADDMCNRLLNFALTEEASVRPMTGQDKTPVIGRFNRKKPIGVRYDFSSSTILKSQDVQRLLGDYSVISIAQSYLACQPILDLVALWWSCTFQETPDSEAAQYFHFDMDRLKWLKFFFYITDVTGKNGPHTFIAKSHRNHGIPKHLLEKGYSRLTDEEVAASFSKEDYIEFAAPRGTVIAEDTRGLHKGKNLQEGDRLVLQFEFASSLFGTNYPSSIIPKPYETSLAQITQEYPRIYSNYTRK